MHDGEIPDGGAELRPAPWRVPDVIPETMVADARVEAQRLEPLLQDVAPESLRRWLIALGNLVARQPGDTGDAEMRLSALCSVLDDEPAGAFTKASLKRAAQRFTFFPSAAELSDFLAHETADLRKRGQRLMMILDAAAKGQPERPDPQGRDFRWSREEAEAHGRRLYEQQAAERRALLRQLGVDPLPVPPKAPGEDERDYVRRLVAFAKDQCRMGEADLPRLARDRERRSYDAKRPGADDAEAVAD